MSQNVRPILSVIVRRFRQEFADDIENSIASIQQAVADQPGFVGLQNSISPKKDDCELVTIITFDTQENLEKWDGSPVRKKLVTALDRLSRDDATNTQFNDLSLLTLSSTGVKKGETIVMLIFWISVLSNLLRYPVNFFVPDSVHQFWRGTLQTTIIVVLISYIFLPFSSIMLTRLKARLSRMRRE